MGTFQSVKYLTQSRNVGSWYSDEAWLVSLSNSWVRRGGDNTDGTGAGMFSFGHARGDTVNSLSFRLVLAF